MKRLQIIFCSFIFAFAFIFSANVINAEESIDTYVDPIGYNKTFDPNTNPIETVAADIVGGIANTFISRVFGVIGIVVLCLFIWAGLKYILARGDSGKVKQANSVMKWSVIGLLIVFSSYIVINFMFTVIKRLGAES